MKFLNKLFGLSLLMVIALLGCENEPTQMRNVQMKQPINDVNDWHLVWHDEFEKTTIDLTKWSFEQNCFGGGNNEKQCYTNSNNNAFIEDGILVIQAIKEDIQGPALSDDDPNYDVKDLKEQRYSSARLRTLNKGDWQYGRFEIRAKLPSGQGTWPAIWMLPTDWKYGRWAASGEIDIMEAVNLKAESDDLKVIASKQENRTHGTLHYGGTFPNNIYSGSAYDFKDNINPADDFHVYAIDWQQDEIRWYVDGNLFATQTSDIWFTQNENGETSKIEGNAPFDQRFHLILNFAVGGVWPEKVNEKGIDESVFPQRFEIDYVRVYQK